MVTILRKWWVWPIIILAVIAIVFTLLPAHEQELFATPSDFVEDARAGRVQEIEVHGKYVDYKVDGVEPTFEMEMEEGQTVRGLLSQAGLDTDEFPSIETGGDRWWIRGWFMIVAFLPVILIVAVLVALLRWLWRKGSATGRVNG